MSKRKRVTKSEKVTTEVVDVVHTVKSALLQDRVIGLTLKEAELLTLGEGKSVRVTREDDTYHVGDAAFHLDRLNVEVEKGIVVRAAIG